MADEIANTAPAVNTPDPITPVVDDGIPELPKNPTGAQAKAYFDAKKAKALEGKPKPYEKFHSDPKTPEPKVIEKTVETPEKVEEKKEEVQPPRKHKVKVDGNEIEVDEDELRRGYSHQRAANKILQEGKLKMKQAEEIIGLLKNEDSIFEVIKKLGLDPRKISEKYLVAQLEEEMLDPKDRELRQYKRRIDEIEANEAKQREQAERGHHEELKKKYAQDYNDQFVKALTEVSLPPTKSTVAEMAKYISQSAKIGIKMNASEAAQLVKQDLMEYQKRLIGEASGEDLIKLFGEDVAKKIRAYDTGKIKSPENYLKTPESQSNRKVGHSGGRMTPGEWARFKRGL